MMSSSQLAKNLGPLAGRTLSHDAWKKATADDPHGVLNAFCPSISLPRRSGEFEVLFVLDTDAGMWRKLVSIPLVWEESNDPIDHVSAPLPKPIKLIESQVKMWASARSNNADNWRIAPRGWKPCHFEAISAQSVDASSGFVAAAAALELKIAYPGLTTVSSVFATGLGHLEQDRLVPADRAQEKYEGACDLLEETEACTRPIRFFAVGDSGTLPAGVEALSSQLQISQALLPLMRAMAAAPEDDAPDDAFDAYFRLLGRGKPQDEFYADRLLPQLCERHPPHEKIRADILISTGSGTIQPPATVAALAGVSHVVLLYTEGSREHHDASNCADYIRHVLKRTLPVLAEESVTLRSVGSHTFDEILARIRECIEEGGTRVALDVTSGSKLFSIAMERLSGTHADLLYMEQVGFPMRPQPMKTRLVLIPPRDRPSITDVSPETLT